MPLMTADRWNRTQASRMTPNGVTRMRTCRMCLTEKIPTESGAQMTDQVPEKPLIVLKQQEKDARRQLILNAARHLFAEKDFRSVTVREIARTAGISIGTIYNYYENLTELFLDVFLKSADDLLARIDGLSGSSSLSVIDLCRLYIDFLQENMTFYQMMGHFMIGGDL